MKLQQNRLWIVLILIFAPGCATLMQGSTQQITVNSTPSGAAVLVDDAMRFTTPAVLDLERKASHTVEISLDGYQSQVINIRMVSSNMALGNIVAGGLIGFAVDHSSGAAFRLVPEVVQVNLKPIAPEPRIIPVAPAPEESQAGTGSQN